MIPLYAKLTEKAIGTADCDKIVRISLQKVKMIILYSEKRFAPVCTPQWQRYSFCVTYHARSIQVNMNADGASYKLISCEPVEISSLGRINKLQ